MHTTRQQFLKKLETLYSLAMRGDADAIGALETIKLAANKGDPRCIMALGALTLINEGQKADAQRWASAASLYVAIKDGDPKAKPILASTVKKARMGKAEAVDLMARLSAVHNQNRSAITGLAGGMAIPQLGGYGLPAFHAAGVQFPGARALMVVGASQAQLVRLYEIMQRALETRPIFQSLTTSFASPAIAAEVSAKPKPRSFGEAMAQQAEDRTQAKWTSMIQRSALPSSSVSSALAGF